MNSMRAQEVTETLKANLRQMSRDAEDLLQATAGKAGEALDEARRRLGKSLAAAKDTAGRWQDRSAETAEAADRVIRQHPYEAIGLAFVAGLLIGVRAGFRG